MEDNQINGQNISKEAYCPNSFFDNGTVSIGEFKTLDDAMNFPIKEIWCINRTEDNKFQSYKSQGSRLLIIDHRDSLTHFYEKYLVVTRIMSIFALYNVNKHSMPRQKQEKSGTGICHVMQGKESKPVPVIFRKKRFVTILLQFCNHNLPVC